MQKSPLLIENNPQSYPLLEAYGKTITDIEVVTKRWDFNKHVQDVVDFSKKSRNCFPFFFIDPTGWDEVLIDRIRPILQVNPGEVLINFMSSWIKRYLGDTTKPFEELLGKNVKRLRTLHGEELDDELVNTYAMRVKEEGRFAYTCAIPILMPDRDDIHYHLVYGTRNIKGLEVFKRTEEVAIPFMHDRRAEAQRRHDEESSPQSFLLSPAETYNKDKRFRSFNARRKTNARAAVIALLNRKRSTTYSSLYEESMQYSTVTKQDLLQWLTDWQTKGSIQYRNWKKGQRVPRPETIVDLIGVL